MKTQKFQRSSFFVEGVLVTEDNLDEIAEWCGGEVLPPPAKYERPGRKGYVKVNVNNPLSGPHNERQGMAFAGDHVVKGVFGPNGTEGFKVYLPKAFDKGFVLVEEEVCGRTDWTADHEPCVLAAGHRTARVQVACRSFRDYLVL